MLQTTRRTCPPNRLLAEAHMIRRLLDVEPLGSFTTPRVFCHGHAITRFPLLSLNRAVSDTRLVLPVLVLESPAPVCLTLLRSVLLSVSVLFLFQN